LPWRYRTGRRPSNSGLRRFGQAANCSADVQRSNCIGMST